MKPLFQPKKRATHRETASDRSHGHGHRVSSSGSVLRGVIIDGIENDSLPSIKEHSNISMADMSSFEEAIEIIPVKRRKLTSESFETIKYIRQEPHSKKAPKITPFSSAQTLNAALLSIMSGFDDEKWMF